MDVGAGVFEGCSVETLEDIWEKASSLVWLKVLTQRSCLHGARESGGIV